MNSIQVKLMVCREMTIWAQWVLGMCLPVSGFIRKSRGGGIYGKYSNLFICQGSFEER